LPPLSIAGSESNRKLGVCGARRLKIDAIMRG
jgi:hypothetical protein